MLKNIRTEIPSGCSYFVRVFMQVAVIHVAHSLKCTQSRIENFSIELELLYLKESIISSFEIL